MSTITRIGKDITNILIYPEDTIIVNEKSISIKSKYGFISHRFEGLGENPKHGLHAPISQKESLFKILELCRDMAIDLDMRSFLILGKNLEIIDIGTDY